MDTGGTDIQLDGTAVSFRHPIKKTIRNGDTVVVLLDVPVGTVDNRNVIGLSTDGDRRWQIEPISNETTADQAYVNIYQKDDAVWAVNPIGAECRLDLDDGSFAETQTVRW